MKFTSITYLTISLFILGAVVSGKSDRLNDVKPNVEEKKTEEKLTTGHDSYGNTIRTDDKNKIDLDSKTVALVHSETPGWWEENPTAENIQVMQDMIKLFKVTAGEDDKIQLDEWKKLAAQWNLTDDAKVEELFRKAAGADMEMSFDEFARLYMFHEIAHEDWMISLDEWLVLFNDDDKEMATKLFEDASKTDVADGEDHEMSFGEYMIAVEFLKVGGRDGEISKAEWNEHYPGHEDVFVIVAGADGSVDFAEFALFYAFYMIAGDKMIITNEDWAKAGMDATIFDLLAGGDHQITIDEYLPYLEFKIMAGKDDKIDEGEWRKFNKPMKDFKMVAGDDDLISLEEYLNYVRNPPKPTPTPEAQEQPNPPTPEAEDQTNPAGKDDSASSD